MDMLIIPSLPEYSLQCEMVTHSEVLHNTIHHQWDSHLVHIVGLETVNGGYLQFAEILQHTYFAHQHLIITLAPNQVDSFQFG